MRHIDPNSVEIGRPRDLRPPEETQREHALPFEGEKKPLDIWKEPPLSTDEIARRKAANARQARREADKAGEARQAIRAKLGLPPLTDAQVKALQEPIQHEDDPEF